MGTRQLLSNLGALTLARGVTATLTLVTTVYVGRVLEPEAYGMLSWGAALLMYFLFVPNLGLNVYGVRASARDPRLIPELAGRILALRLTLGTATAVLFATLVFLSPLSPLLRAVVLIQGIALIAHALSVEWAFEGQQRMGLLASRHIVVAVASTALVLAFVRRPGDVLVAAAIPPLALFLGNAWLLATHVRTFGPFRLDWSTKAWKPLVVAGLPIAASLFMVQVYTGTDQVMLGILRENEDVGLYAAAYRFVAAALIPLHIVLQAFAPYLSVQARDRTAMQQAGATLLQTLAGIGLPLTLVAGALSLPLMGLFGEQYLAAAPVLSILMVSVAAGYLHTGLGRALIYWNHERPYMWSLSVGAAANVALNLWLIPRHGGLGAAIATLLTELLVLAIIAAAYRRVVGGVPGIAVLRGAGATVIGVGLVGFGVRTTGAGWPLQLAAVAVAYPAVATLTGVLPRALIARIISRSPSEAGS